MVCFRKESYKLLYGLLNKHVLYSTHIIKKLSEYEFLRGNNKERKKQRQATSKGSYFFCGRIRRYVCDWRSPKVTFYLSISSICGISNFVLKRWIAKTAQRPRIKISYLLSTNALVSLEKNSSHLGHPMSLKI